MERPVVFDWEARDELDDARQWYAQRNPEAARRFVDAFRAAMSRLEESPERWVEFQPGVRRVLVHRFPFAIVYVAEPERIIVLAVMHMSRRPGYWLRRKGDEQPP